MLVSNISDVKRFYHNEEVVLHVPGILQNKSFIQTFKIAFDGRSFTKLFIATGIKRFEFVLIRKKQLRKYISFFFINCSYLTSVRYQKFIFKTEMKQFHSK